MPLPTALAEKLAQRGICVSSQTKSNLENDQKCDFRNVVGCPNKSNIYHECNNWCEVRWKPSNVPEPKYMQNIGKLLQKYPLPHTWTEIFDCGIQRYYFWDMESDYVSWLPPQHPKAKSSKSASKKREKRLKRILRDHINYKKSEDNRDRRHSKSTRKGHSRKSVAEKRLKHSDKKNRKKSRQNYVDPMDPAAYSNVPIGTWNDGLEFKKPESSELPSGRIKKNVSFGISSSST